MDLCPDVSDGVLSGRAVWAGEDSHSLPGLRTGTGLLVAVDQDDALESGSSKKRTLLRGDIVRYDASYFRKPSAHEGVPLKATHRVVEPDALADLEEVDLEHVLIWDFCDVDEYTRTLQDKKYYPGGIVPTDPERLRRVKVKGKQGKRQLVSLATWKHREGQRAELRRKQTLVQASAFKGERSER